MAKNLENQSTTMPASVRWGRILIVIGGIAALFFVGQLLIDMVVDELNLQVRASTEPMLHRIIMTVSALYVVLMCIPFMPAAEIALSMLLIFGGKIAFLVYVCTVAALTLAFLIGRVLPVKLIAKAFGGVGLSRAQNFANRLAPLRGEQRMAVLMSESPARMVPWLVRHRYLALAVLLNIPGNAVIGGGGGIAMAAGMTRLFSFPAYLLTVALAVGPVPLAFYLTA